MSDFQDSVVLIETTDDLRKHGFGTGFVVHRDERGTYLLTCAHVVTKKTLDSKDFQLLKEVKVSSDGGLILAEIEDWDRVVDLAVLRVQGLYSLPMLSLCSSGQPDMPFITAGFYEFDKRSTQRQINQIKGKLLKSEYRIRQQGDRARVWKVEIADGELLKPGYSGSPALDETGSHVFGVVSNLEGEEEKESNIGWMVSIEALGKVWSKMPSNLLQHLSNPQPEPRVSFPPSSIKLHHLKQKFDELRREYDYWTKKIQKLDESQKLVDLSPEQSFKLDNQIEYAERKRDEIEQSMYELERQLQ